MNQVHRASCAKAPRDRGCVKGAYRKKDCKANDFALFSNDSIKTKMTTRAPAPVLDIAVSEKTLERFATVVCLYLVWHCVEASAVNIFDSSSWLKVRAALLQHCRICTAAGLSSWLLLHSNACWHINVIMTSTR
jgi:hypothetical protein